MRSLIHKLAESAGDGPGTLLVIGAGQGTDLAPLRRRGAKRLILVEANPKLAEVLSQRIDPGRGEEVWSLAATPEERSEAILRIVNHPDHSSLAAPEALSEYFQNLCVTHETAVPARSLKDIIEALALDPSERHEIIVDAPGLSGVLLDVTPVEQLQLFRRLIVRGGARPLYAGEPAMAQVAAAMRDKGFDMVADDAEAIFPHQSMLLERNDAACQAQARERETVRLVTGLQERLVGVTGERDAEKARVAELQAQVEQLTLERDTHAHRVAELQATVQAQAQAREQDGKAREQEKEAQAGRIAELAAQLEVISGQRDTRASQLADAEAELQKLATDGAAQARQVAAQLLALTQERDAARKQAAELRAQLDAKGAECAAQAKLAEDRMAQALKQSQEVEAAAKRVAERDATIATLGKDLEAAKMQAEALQEKLEKAGRLAQERGARVIELERERTELNRYQSWLNTEVIKAEAHVDLIKEILLREPGR